MQPRVFLPARARKWHPEVKCGDTFFNSVRFCCSWFVFAPKSRRLLTSGTRVAVASLRPLRCATRGQTRRGRLPEEKFDFLGYTFGRCYSMRRGRVYLGTAPSKKRVQRICRAISEETGRDALGQNSQTIVERLNRMMIGWANYFCLGSVSQAYSAVDMHARRRLRRWLCDKHNAPRPGYLRFPEASLHSVFGLVQLPHRTASLPWT